MAVKRAKKKNRRTARKHRPATLLKPLTWSHCVPGANGSAIMVADLRGLAASESGPARSLKRKEKREKTGQRERGQVASQGARKAREQSRGGRQECARTRANAGLTSAD